MQLLFEDGTQFKKFVDGLAALVDEAEFIVDEKGFGLKATDPSQISLVDFLLPKKAFREFDCPVPTKLGVDLNYFNQIMSRAKAGDSVTLSVSDERSKLSVIFNGSSKRSFVIPLLDLNSADLPLPRIEFDSEVKVKADALQDSFKDAALISTHVILSVENDSFVLRANSSKGNLENVYSHGNKSLVSLRAKQETRAMFPLDYLVSILKAASSDTEITLNFKSNAPVEVTYSLGEGKMQYFLAPRIEND
ncbi:MAG TPA: proliferating cell nuclear antigen (pcna) [Candidatus Diapherotrites archaeon]|uniref:DNA polymerase sliding clamp n=1 Tax=Candidatus Iainarchaeum sp. TaxID=3101447 RepID=A0A7J4IZZ2_9ARCH|nr:proliferating cell nuclear antigen (pcna) [Candidatus Diapherotrites archaeon]